MKIPATGGTPVQLARDAGCFPSISPDGKLVAYGFFDNGAAYSFRTAIISMSGGSPLQTLELPQHSEWRFKREVKWTPDGQALTYSDTKDGVANLWRMPIRGGSPQQITHFKSEQIFSFAWSRDGRQLAVVRGARVRDAVEIRFNR
jgi:Tol biopolymer transport system component